MSFHSPNIPKSLLETVAAVLAGGTAGRMLAKSPTAKKDMEAADDVKSASEYNEQLAEGPETDVAKREEIARAIAQSIVDFKKRYGKDWQQVLNVSKPVVQEGVGADNDEDVAAKKEELLALTKKLIAKYENSGRVGDLDRHIKRIKELLLVKGGEQIDEGAFSEIDIEQQEMRADPKIKAAYNKEFSELIARRKRAELNPSERRRIVRLSLILGKKLPDNNNHK